MFATSTEKSVVPAGRRFRRFRRNRDGSAAVEFALVAPLFFALLFAIIETGLVFFAGQALETATQEVARLVLTGQAQKIGYTQQQFKGEVCKRLTTLFDCSGGVHVDVESFSSFSSITPPDVIDDGNFVPTDQYNPGNACDVVVVRLFYQWPIYVTGFGYDLSNLAGKKRLLMGTAAFRNEPFGAASC
jgi:Flp pilus assembly protein TadG